MSSKRKLSGHEYRQKRKQVLISESKQRNALDSFFTVNNQNTEPNTDNNNVIVEIPQNSSNFQEIIPVVGNPPCSDNSLVTLDFEDPGMWPELNDRILTHLVEKGPKQIDNICFPISSGRKFNPKYYTRVLSNGDKVRRSWLVYSVSKNSIFCFCCKLFTKNSSIAISSSGFKGWAHLTRLLPEHEQSPVHVENFKKWMEFEQRLS